jgi:tRNA nucleotidyltransferase (CCA-adding enzyme)
LIPGRPYLVGGAVRDELLGLAPRERDWVVTGATPEAMKKAGFRQVGAAFPVFLHPVTGEEYALARTERKSGHGYHGFSVDFAPDVSIEQDLERRDLTINAMARDGEGRLIDPYHGQRDLRKKWLRHVSEAFAEDPLRVLRVARFAARYDVLGFRVHPETLDLMRSITADGELDHLVPERVWVEIRGALGAGKPARFITTLRDCGALAVLLPEVDCLFGVPQPEQHHPEVDCGEHLLLCLDVAAELQCRPATVFAVLLHDLGKGVTPPGQWPRHLGHEQAGLPLVDAVCTRFRVPKTAQQLARQVCSGHLRAHRVLDMKPDKVMRLLEDLDALRSGDIGAFLLACEADFRGRGGLRDRPYPQAAFLHAALKAALDVNARDLDLAGVTGPEIGRRLRAARVAAIAQLPVDPAQQAAEGTG